MNKLQSGIGLIILGNILYLSYIYFTGNEKSSLAEFGSGLLLGLSIGINLVGIILTVNYITNSQKKEKKQFLGGNFWKKLVLVYWISTIIYNVKLQEEIR